MTLGSIIIFCLGFIAGVVVQAYVPSVVNGLESGYHKYQQWVDHRTEVRYHELHPTEIPK